MNHFELVLKIASSFSELAGIHHSLAKPFSKQGRFDEEQARVEQLKSHAVNNALNLSGVM